MKPERSERVIDHECEDSAGPYGPGGLRKETSFVLDVLEGQNTKYPS